MQQAAFLDGLSLDLLPSSEDGVCLTEVGVGGCHVVEALVVLVVVVGDIPSLYRPAQAPGDEVAALVV